MAGRTLGIGSLLAAAVVSSTSMPAAAQDLRAIQRQLQEMQKIIQQQQKTIEALEEQVRGVQSQQATTQEQVKAAETKASEAVTATKTPPVVGNAIANVKLTVSGQINRMINLAGDGHNTKFYFVDNNNAASRIVARGDARLTEDITARSNIELGLSPNNSGQISQTSESQSTNETFDLRKIEGIFASKEFGTLYFGKGDPSTKDIARNDLSGTEVLAYTNVADIAGGLQFWNEQTDAYATNIKSAFTDLDPSRQNRIRYDTPKLLGFDASITGADNQRSNGAVRWAGQTDQLQASAGIGISNPNLDGVDYDIAGSGSVLHTPTGLNLSAGTGRRFRDETEPNFYYVKAGWRAKLIDLGRTNLSLDWQRTNNFLGSNNVESSAQGSSIGAALVQNLNDYGVDLYAGYRYYTFFQQNTDLDSVHVGTVGTRVKF